MRESNKPKAIDLFCGCGGISAGLERAGFEVIAGVDIEPNYISTFTHNFPSAKSLELDLSNITPSDFMRTLGLKKGELDLLAGGPPCQGFSKNVPRKYRYLEDPRNRLLKSFLDYCEFLKPRFVLLENVAEMKNGFDQAYSDEILERLHNGGYNVSHAVLNAADYGVPQRRRRAFFIACREGKEMQFPLPTHAQQLNTFSLFPTPQHITVWEAIGDLPSIKHGEGREMSEYACAPFSEYQRLMRNGNRAVTNHIARFLQPTQYERLSSLEPGQGLKDLPERLKTKGGYSGAYGRLTKDMIAPTITRWVFHPGSGRWGHPVDTRLLTIREVARIQSFPDDFEFVGTYVQMAGQLGNAVPPLLAQRIGESMLSHVAGFKVASNSMNFSTLIFSSSVGK
jgi:DNA (cytosine-5)-methyltransferase 1